MMRPADLKQGKMDLLEAPRTHNLVLKAGSPPAWKSNWLAKIPFVGHYLYLWLVGVWTYTTEYEGIADFLAEDLEQGSEEWLGQKVAFKKREEAQVAQVLL